MPMLVSDKPERLVAAACVATLMLSAASDPARAQQVKPEGFKAPATIQSPSPIKQPSLRDATTGNKLTPRGKMPPSLNDPAGRVPYLGDWRCIRGYVNECKTVDRRIYCYPTAETCTGLTTGTGKR